MKKFLPVVLLIATLALSACGTANNQNTTSTNPEKERTNTQENGTETSLKSIKDLLTLGTTQKCTFESKDKEVTTTSEIIVSGKKFKQVTEVKDEEGTMKVYGISDGTYFYSWNDKIKGNGMKMKMEEIENSDKNNPSSGEAANTEGQQQVDINKAYNYKCTPATLSESDLALPSDVKFTDFTEFLKGIQSGNVEDYKKLIPSQGE